MLLAVLGGVAGAAIGALLFARVVPDWGTGAADLLAWVRTVGLADLGPQNAGGVVGCIAGTVATSRLVGLRRAGRVAAACLLALVAWVLVSLWLFYGLRIQDLFSSTGTGG